MTKKQCLLMNGCKAVNYESRIIKFTYYNKQAPILFKIYADTECFLKRTNSIGAKFVCVDHRFTLPSIIFKGKDCINEFIIWVLDKQKWAKQINKKYFDRRLITVSKDEEIYRNTYICWICKQESKTNKVKDHCHVIGKIKNNQKITNNFS